MTNILNTKVLLSGAMIAAAAAVVVGATFAFFSDTETSTDNTFVAGAIDLKVDNTSYAIDNVIPGFVDPTGELVANPANTWTSTDLTQEKFFNFTDLKPGDYGEDTISLTVDNNDAYVCAAARVTSDLDNTITEPEDEVGGPALSDGTVDGDLDSGVNFAFWNDDGDNVLEVGENIFLQGPLSGLGSAGQIALADASTNIWTGVAGDSVLGATTAYIGKGWCYGTLTPAPVAQGENSPLTNTGFTCDGSSVGNIGQTDSVTGDLQFYAVQSRNNSDFTCSEDYDPVWPVVTPTP